MTGKNVILFHIDSLNYQRLFQSPSLSSADNAPFLHRLASQCVSCDQMYSQAPFTEAAVKALMSGVNTLDDGGYLLGFAQTPQILYEVLAQNGYDIYSNYYPNITPYSQRRGVNYPYYAVNYEFRAVWDYRLSYYQQIYQAGQLTDRDYADIIQLLDDNFAEWERFLTLLAKENDLTEIVRSNGEHTIPCEQSINQLREQIKIYRQNPRKAIHALLDQGLQHALFSIEPYRLNRKIKDPAVIRQVQHKYLPFLKQSYRRNRNCNLLYNPLSLPLIGRLLMHLLKSRHRADLMQLARYLFNYKKCIFNDDLLYRITGDYTAKSDSLSARGFIDHFLKWHDTIYTKSSPFFAYIQLSDFHYRESFFSYDSEDLEVIDQDFAALQTFYKNLPKKFRGALSSEYALIYLDRCMQYAYEQLKQRGRLEDTAIIFTSDHGFTFGFDPVRPTTLINFHEENYHVPFLLYDQSISPRSVEGLHTTCDIPATVLDICGIEKPDHFAGASLLQPKQQASDIIHMEFMGSGCPDMVRRPVMLCARSQQYKICYKGMLNQPFNRDDIYELYDLKSDPREMKNLAEKTKSLQLKDVEKLIQSLKNRFLQLQQAAASSANAIARQNANKP